VEDENSGAGVLVDVLIPADGVAEFAVEEQSDEKIPAAA